MAEPEGMIVPLLREMRAEMKEGFTELRERMDRMEKTHANFRHALIAESLTGKFLTGEFEERIEALEQKVRELESHK